MPAAQGIPACAGMTIERGAGVTKNTLKHGVTKSMPVAQGIPACAGMTADGHRGTRGMGAGRGV